jgi:hypothetical protein
MVALEDAILDANQILFIEENQTNFRIGFRWLPAQANGGSFSAVFVKKTPENRRRLSAAMGVELSPRTTTPAP